MHPHRNEAKLPNHSRLTSPGTKTKFSLPTSTQDELQKHLSSSRELQDQHTARLCLFGVEVNPPCSRLFLVQRPGELGDHLQAMRRSSPLILFKKKMFLASSFDTASLERTFHRCSSTTTLLQMSRTPGHTFP